MDSKELRIGNLVTINDKLITMDVRIFHAVLHGFYGYNPDPIPITEEWLNKFILPNDVGVEECGGNIRIYVRNTGFDIDELTVHRFQNIVHSLTGEELCLKP